VETQICPKKACIASEKVHWSPPYESSHAEEAVGDDESSVGCEEEGCVERIDLLHTRYDEQGGVVVDTDQRAPAGKFRVIVVDLFSHEDYLVDDYDSRDEAFTFADEHNMKRSGSMDDVYYVYDDRGTYIRGNEAVGQKISP
jgi:hypothetical protein